MRAKGIVIDEPDLAPFQAMMEPAYSQIRNKVGAANFDKWMEMTKSVK
jgi:TRAP-type C4-dicarboxylate transport system substrate-binding protein